MAAENTPGDPLELLRERLNELTDIEGAASLLHWDQETIMPPAATAIRAEQRATLERLAHERFVAADVGGWLEQLPADEEPQAPVGEPQVAADRDAALVRVARRDRDKAMRVPGSLLADLERAGALGHEAWVKARRADDFSLFLPQLRTIVELRRRYIECFPDVEHPYDALLDDYEPGMRTAEVRAVFAALRDGLVPIVAAIASAREQGRGAAPLTGRYPADAQRRMLREVLVAVGFDAQRYLLDESAHPFSTGTSPDDRRITVRFDEEQSLESLYSGLHEFGHALYEAQIDRALARTPLGTGVSLSLHESQSRLWENMVGRGRPFCEYVLPHLTRAFPQQLRGVDADELYRRVNVVRPSLIRVQADEVTYALHVIVRFELEVELFEGALQPEQLPQAWRERMLDYLGVEVPDDATGVLQDIHWSMGAFGYFPTYALGNLVAAQLWTHIRAEMSQLDENTAHGDFSALRDWLGAHVHRFGRMFTPVQTLERAVGERLDPQPFLDYLHAKHSEIHGI